MKKKKEIIPSEQEKAIFNEHFFGMYALVDRKKMGIFLLITLAAGCFIYALPALRDTFPFLQDKGILAFLVFVSGMLSGLLARLFVKRRSDDWSSVLYYFMKHKFLSRKATFIEKFVHKNQNWTIWGYFFAFYCVLSGLMNIEYSSVAFTFSRQVNNSIIPAAGFVFFSLTWGFLNFCLLLRLECLRLGINQKTIQENDVTDPAQRGERL